MTDLRLPTVPVPILLLRAGHEVVSAAVFLADVARSGRVELFDHVAQLLDGAVSFLPVRMVDDQVVLLATHAIVWIALDASDGQPAEVSTLHDRHYPVDVELVGGSHLAGVLLDSSPADRPRAIDHLNRAGAFIRLWTPDRHYLINKAQIVGVTES